MINKLYSILASGCNNIPEDFGMYRKYTNINVDIPEIPTYKDPFRRSMWANYIISLARTSWLYTTIRELDPANSYDIDTKPLQYSFTVDNADVTSMSEEFPVLDIEGDIQGNIVTYTYNNVGPVMSDLGVLRNIDVLGYNIALPAGDIEFSVDICNPSVNIDIPSASSVLTNSRYISDLLPNVDINDVWDRSALFCIYVLRRYNGDRG